MKRQLIYIFAALLLIGPGIVLAQDEKPAVQTAVEYLDANVGLRALDILEERGYVVSNGRKGDDREILFVQWDNLKRLTSLRNEISAFIRVFSSPPEYETPEKDGLFLRKLQEAPVGGLLTPALHSSVDVLAAHIEERNTLKSDPGKTSLFEEKWSRGFTEGEDAGALTDMRPLVRPYFRDFVGKPEATRHLTEYFKRIGASEKIIFEDLRAGRMSKNLGDLLLSYLLDQKRLWNVHKTEERLKKIARSSSVEKDISDLQSILDKIENPDSFIREFQKSVQSETKRAHIRFRGTDLHVRVADRDGSQDPGDEVVVSMAYWVEGLNPREITNVFAIGFVDDPQNGATRRMIESSRRKDGGPYTISTRLKLDSQKPLTYRLYLSASGAETFKTEATIDVSPDFHDAVSAAAAADNLLARCRLKEAAIEFKKIEEELAEWKQKPQFKEFLSDIRARSEETARLRKILAQLKDSLDGAKLFASKEQCRYRTDRVDRALSLLRDLPPGCEHLQTKGGKRLSTELIHLSYITQKRAFAQKSFDERIALAEKEERDCRFPEAAESFASALALLEATPAARCGRWETKYASVKIKDLPRAAGASALSGSIEGDIARAEQAFAQGKYARTMGILYPLAAGIRALPNESCYSNSLQRADAAAQAAAVALDPVGQEGLKILLPKDPVGNEMLAVQKASRRLREERRQIGELKSNLESPNAPELDEEPAQ